MIAKQNVEYIQKRVYTIYIERKREGEIIMQYIPIYLLYIIYIYIHLAVVEFQLCRTEFKESKCDQLPKLLSNHVEK